MHPLLHCRHVGPAILLGAVAFASLASAEPGSTEAVKVPAPVQLASLPGASDQVETSHLPVSSVLLFSAFSPIAAAKLTNSDLGLRDMLGRETAYRDATAATVLPPPRPGFTEVRLRPTDPGDGPILEVRAPSGEPAWSEPDMRSDGLWPWLAPGPGAGEQPLKPERALQAGVASWYGPGFHGRRTASGEVFNQNAMTAAHKSLPFGTKVKVVDQKTGRSVVVRINDRGPFKPGRVVDLSKAAAAALGMGGLARVRIVSAE